AVMSSAGRPESPWLSGRRGDRGGPGGAGVGVGGGGGGGWATRGRGAPAGAARVPPPASPAVKVGYIPSDSFAALYIMADRHLPAADVAVETVKMSGGSEILSQGATGQLTMGGTGMGAAGFNAVAASLPVELVAPLPSVSV